MPLTSKGKKILKNMNKFYKRKTGNIAKGEQVFYAMINEGKLSGVEKSKGKKRSKKNEPSIS